MFVIGTAGHVDHGKSTLVKALTGIDPDRLREEKAREMTIDLGFAWLKLPGLPDDEEVGVVDVPGHRDFIENMLAGVGGIDLALLVIAADEGIMPQTEEHLHILDLLAVKTGVVALTKTDLVDDPDWIELVELEVSEALEGTVLAGAEIIPVSAREGEGLDRLKTVIVDRLLEAKPRQDNGRPRLPIDRIFSITGFGTIVTGTLLDGQLKIGDSVEVIPKDRKGRIRGLQSHKTKREVAQPGSRVAVNITGIEKNELARGDVLAAEGVLRPTTLIDTLYKQLSDADGPLKHNAQVKLFSGSAEVLARARVLGQEEIAPGHEGWVQFALEESIAVLRNDRFIVRRPSPPATIGGGRILDPYPGRQHRRFRKEVLDRLRTIEHGTPGELLLQKLIREEPANVNKFKRRSGLEAADFDAALDEILTNETAILIENQLLSTVKLARYVSDTVNLVTDFHQNRPLRIGMSLEEVRSRLQIPAGLMGTVVEQTGLVQADGKLKSAEHSVAFEPALEAKINQQIETLNRANVQTPLVKEVKQSLGEDVYFALLDQSRLIQLNDDVIYTAEGYEKLKQDLIQFIETKGAVTAGDVRDYWQTSRKYAIAFLEHLDQNQITRRDGDQRKLK